MVPRIGFPVVHAERFQDPSDLIQTVGDAEVGLDQALCLDGCPVLFLSHQRKEFGFLIVREL